MITDTTSAICFKSILAGIVVALSIQAILNLFGVGIGLLSFEINKETFANLSFSAILWVLLTGIIAIFFGSFIAGKVSGFREKMQGCQQGIITWSATTLITLLLTASSSGMMLGGAYGLINQGVTLINNNTQQEQQGEMSSFVLQQNSEKNLVVEQQTTEDVSNALGIIALLTFLSYLIGLVASIYGGTLGTRRN